MAVRIGLIGCGGIARNHVQGYLSIPEEVQVTAVSDVVAENARQMAETVGGARVFADFHALIAEGEIDAVDVCLPHVLHKDAVVAAALAGKHVLCEKPLCLSISEAHAIQRAVTQSGITLMCAHNQLFFPAIRKAKEFLSAGLLGRIYEIRTLDTFRHPWNTPNMGWRSKRETMGGGELIDTGYHPSYLMLYLADSTPVEVAAMLGTHRIPMDGEDSAQVLVRFANGSIGNIVTSWAYPIPLGSWQFHLIGERGQLYGRDDTLHYTLLDGTHETLRFSAVDTFIEETVDFVACLRDKRTPVQTEANGIAVLKLILGAYQSAEEKRIVPLA